MENFIFCAVTRTENDLSAEYKSIEQNTNICLLLQGPSYSFEIKPFPKQI